MRISWVEIITNEEFRESRNEKTAVEYHQEKAVGFYWA